MSERETIRHVLATLNYRFRGAVHGAPKSFWTYMPPGDGWTAVEIVHHINDLLRGVVRAFDKGSIVPMSPTEPKAELAAFSKLVKLVDEHLKKTELKGKVHGRQLTLAILLQGPLSDAMTHVGQLAQLRRQAGSPVEPQPTSNLASFRNNDVVLMRQLSDHVLYSVLAIEIAFSLSGCSLSAFSSEPGHGTYYSRLADLTCFRATSDAYGWSELHD